MHTEKLLKYCLAFLLVSCASEKERALAPVPVSVEMQKFQVLTLDNMDDYQGSILEYVMDTPRLQVALNEALHHNRDLCKQDHEPSCKAIEPLKAQREDLHQGLIDITWVKGCSTQAAIQERKKLTGKSDPRLLKKLKIYREAYKRESGQVLDLSKCE